MDILLLIVTIVNIQVVRCCPPYIFPEDIPDECCSQKENGGELFLYLTQAEPEEYQEHGCQSDCVYYKEGDQDSRYCFKKGGALSSECTIGSHCNTTSDEDLQKQYVESLEILAFNLEGMVKFVKDLKGVPKTYHNLLVYLYKFTRNTFTPAQEEVLVKALPCSDIKIKCDQCFKALTDSIFECYENPNVQSCKSTLPRINSTCQACLCDISQKCKPGFQCPKGISSENKVTSFNSNDPTDDAQDRNPCDRECSDNQNMKCVFNLTLESLSSDTEGCKADGRKRTVLAYNKQIPGPPLVICEGDELVVNLKNLLDEPTTLHFHGIRENYRSWSDGVASVTQCPIKKNGNFTYGFNATDYFQPSSGTYTQAGTYWYHSHIQTQRTDGAYGPLIIRPIKAKPETRFDHDYTENTIMLQEWYENPEDKNIKSLLINGKGRAEIQDFDTNYEVYTIQNPGEKYLFRIIGAISENIPLRLSIDEHTFTAIAADSQDIQPVPDLTDLWIAGGERFHIVVNTKEVGDYSMGTAYKIRVFGYGDIASKADQFCTIAWLKYPNQTVDDKSTTPGNCIGFDLPTFHRTLNPVPNEYSEWQNRLEFGKWQNTTESGNIYITDLRALQTKPTLLFSNFTQEDTEAGMNNTLYFDLKGNAFNGIKMNYSAVPVLLQDAAYVKAHESERCGTECDFTLHEDPTLPDAIRLQYLQTNCSSKRPERCNTEEPCFCEHVNKQPYASGYWVDILLINNEVGATAHPIHIRGGWSWVMGMDQFPDGISSADIRNMNEDCEYKDHCLWKNLHLPPAKDTIQVPAGGYVLLRTPLDNKGAWFMHCHINKHLLEGMAMVLQIGGVGHDKKLGQDWCTGPGKINGEC